MTATVQTVSIQAGRAAVVPDLEVHPVADLFPMLAGDDLAELAADIKARGLLQPIVLDQAGRILDGRNRHAACLAAGVEPTFETYSGDDPDGYALTVNITRRHLRPGQRYIVMEQARRVSELLNSSFDGSTKIRLSEAAVVIDYSTNHDLIDDVMSGGKNIQAAAKEARERKRAIAEREVKVKRLRCNAKDLAALVDDEAMDIDEAIAALEVREEKTRRDASEAEQKRKDREQTQREQATRISDSLRTIVGRVQVLYKTKELRAEVARSYSADLGDAMPAKVNADSLRQCAEYLTLLADQWKEPKR